MFGPVAPCYLPRVQVDIKDLASYHRAQMGLSISNTIKTSYCIIILKWKYIYIYTDISLHNLFVWCQFISFFFASDLVLRQPSCIVPFFILSIQSSGSHLENQIGCVTICLLNNLYCLPPGCWWSLSWEKISSVKIRDLIKNFYIYLNIKHF